MNKQKKTNTVNRMMSFIMSGLLLISMSGCGDKQQNTETPPANDMTATDGALAANDTPAADGGASAYTTPPAEGDVQAQSAQAGDTINYDGETFSFSYLKYEMITDSENQPSLAYYYSFTNKGDKKASAATTCFLECYQGGEMCTAALLFNSDPVRGNGYTFIEPGESVESYAPFVLRDNSEVTIKLYFGEDLNEEKFSQKISLQ